MRAPGVPASTSGYIYLNRCSGGCTVMGGADDARAMTSGIIAPGTYTLSEFENDQGQTGTAADAAWAALLTCVQEVYSPFAVTVSDQPPSNGVSYTMALVAGLPTEVGLDNGILGVGEVLPDCSPQDNIISFSFANHEGGTGQARMLDTCWTIAQETAHNFGLDHEYQFTDGNSACSDPMTYRTDCGGQKFFRNKPAACGEYAARSCKCGGTQNSVNKLQKVLGAGTSTIPAPTVDVTSPAAGPVTSGFIVHASAGSRRGVEKVELWLNNHLWATANGAAFGQNGQPNPSNYTLTAPSNVPDGVIDMVVKAYDDSRSRDRQRRGRAAEGLAMRDRRHVPHRPEVRGREVLLGSADRDARRRLHLQRVLPHRDVPGLRYRPVLHAGLRRERDRCLPGQLRLRSDQRHPGRVPAAGQRRRWLLQRRPRLEPLARSAHRARPVRVRPRRAAPPQEELMRVTRSFIPLAARIPLAALILIAALAAPALAEAPVVLSVEVPARHKPDDVLGSQVIYLNNCSTGCTVKPGSTDATADTSQLVSKQAVFNEYAWLPGEWDQVVTCVKEVYSPFNVTVTDVRPAGAFNEAIVAGNPQDVGLPNGVGGVGELSNDCSPLTNAVSFAFAESAVDIFAAEDANNRVWGICWVISQEIAHLYGLDHEYQFTDSTPACNDPMTYRADCGGQKFFRNKPAQCGEFGPARLCKCGGLQNSHAKFETLFGPGMSIVPAPTVSITQPAAGPVTTGFAVHASAGSRRGVEKVELWLNNHLWVTAKGAPFGASGQANPAGLHHGRALERARRRDRCRRQGVRRSSASRPTRRP